MIRSERLHDVGHLDRRHHRGEALVALLGAAALDRLFEVLGRDDTVEDGHARLEGDLRERLGRRRLDERRVRRRALHHRAERDDGVELLLRELLRRQRDLIGAGHLHERQVLLLAAMTDERVDRALHELLGEKAVEPADNYRDLHPLRGQCTIDFLHFILPFSSKRAFILSNASVSVNHPPLAGERHRFSPVTGPQFEESVL